MMTMMMMHTLKKICDANGTKCKGKTKVTFPYKNKTEKQ